MFIGEVILQRRFSLEKVFNGALGVLGDYLALPVTLDSAVSRENSSTDRFLRRRSNGNCSTNVRIPTSWHHKGTKAVKLRSHSYAR